MNADAQAQGVTGRVEEANKRKRAADEAPNEADAQAPAAESASSAVPMADVPIGASSSSSSSGTSRPKRKADPADLADRNVLPAPQASYSSNSGIKRKAEEEADDSARADPSHLGSIELSLLQLGCSREVNQTVFCQNGAAAKMAEAAAGPDYVLNICNWTITDEDKKEAQRLMSSCYPRLLVVSNCHSLEAAAEHQTACRELCDFRSSTVRTLCRSCLVQMALGLKRILKSSVLSEACRPLNDQALANIHWSPTRRIWHLSWARLIRVMVQKIGRRLCFEAFAIS